MRAGRRAGELERVLARVRAGTDVVPVEDVLAESGLPPRLGWRQRASGEALRGGIRVGVERRVRVAGIPGPPSDLDLLGVPALRVMKSPAGGSTGRPEKRLTARSNEPHQALTGVERPRYGARSAARTSAACVAAAKYAATDAGS